MNVVRFGALQTFAGLIVKGSRVWWAELRWTALTFSLISFWTSSVFRSSQLSQVSCRFSRSRSFGPPPRAHSFNSNARQLNAAFCGKMARVAQQYRHWWFQREFSFFFFLFFFEWGTAQIKSSFILLYLHWGMVIDALNFQALSLFVFDLF